MTELQHIKQTHLSVKYILVTSQKKPSMESILYIISFHAIQNLKIEYDTDLPDTYRLWWKQAQIL